MFIDLLEKYNVAVPRYTSYPTVPMWDNIEVDSKKWIFQAKECFDKNEQISLYIHLPYCESLCTYCGCNKYITKNHSVEEPYIEALLKEWSIYVKALGRLPKVKELHLGGGTPTFFSPENLNRLIQGIFKFSQIDGKCEMSFEAHPSSTNYEHLKVLKEIGFNRMSLGVQDFDEGIMKTIHRFQTLEQIENISSYARKLAYDSINYDLIYGLPGQNKEHIQKNMELLKSLKPDRIAFYSYAHIPTVKPGQRAYSEEDLLKGRDKLELYQCGRQLMLEMGYVDIGMDHFALKNDSLYKSMKNRKLHRNFMGYTAMKTDLSIGLGASAISDCGSAYAQNEKNVKLYIQKLQDREEVPLIKNHFLNEEDKRVKDHILNLICHFETNWLSASDAYLFENNELLVQMEEDGLVRRFPRQIKVSPKGKNFIRNICSALDMRMKASQGTAVFSKAV
tara:strand:+ start:55894 stop:57240 length:1347 start_codon:yes stop_codon:yes gene_type:complete